MADNNLSTQVESAPPPRPAVTPIKRGPIQMVPPTNAWRILKARTGGAVSRPTFYRWLSNGTIYSVRVGHRFYIPWPVIEEVIGRCRAGDRIDR